MGFRTQPNTSSVSCPVTRSLQQVVREVKLVFLPAHITGVASTPSFSPSFPFLSLLHVFLSFVSYLFIHLSTHFSYQASTIRSFIHTSLLILFFLYPFIPLFLHPRHHPSIHLFLTFHPSIHSSFHLFLSTSIHSALHDSNPNPPPFLFFCSIHPHTHSFTYPPPVFSAHSIHHSVPPYHSCTPFFHPSIYSFVNPSILPKIPLFLHPSF